MSKFFHGASLLAGNNTTPGVQIPEELKVLIPDIFQACRDYGLDFYPTVVQMLSYDEISEIAAYGGFPVRYPHWQWGMEYEELQRGYEYGMHRIYELVVNCCGLATKVLTKRGRLNACDVIAGDSILGPSGWRDVVLVKKQPKATVHELIFNELGLKTVCTPNHKWKVVRSCKAEWVKTSDLKSGDLVLAGSDYSSNINRSVILDWSKDKVLSETRSNVRNRLLPIDPPKHMTLELAELMGILTGDGSVGTRLDLNTISVCVHKPLVDYKNHILNLFEKVFNKSASLVLKKISVDVVNFSSKYAVDFLNTIGFKAGCTYKNKRVPWSVLSSSNEYRSAYIRGLFDTDGYCGKYLSLSCFSDELAHDIQLMLLEMGIASKFKRVINKNNNIAILTIKGKSNIRKFKKYIGFTLKYKSEALKELCEKDGRSGKSYEIKGMKKAIIERIGEIEDVPLWMYQYKRSVMNDNSNSLYGFLNKAINSGYEEIFGDLFKLIDQPMYVLKSNDLTEDQETIDIALDHDDHDFLANGLMSHNTNPCYLYCLDSNTVIDNVTVIAHALGHNDFFKNNVFFEKTSQNMMNQLANNGTRIRKYMARWGKEKVTEFIDHCLRITTLIDPSKAWDKKQIKDVIIKDTRKWSHPKRLNIKDDHEYMDRHINKPEWIKHQNDKIKERELAQELELFNSPTKDIMPFIRDNAPLKPWQADIMAMLYQESIYFAPQRTTKMLNEGWASKTDSEIMSAQNFVSLGMEPGQTSIIEYAKHKMGVLGGKYSTNPYKLGYSLFLDIEERWNKGKFGSEYDDCQNMNQKLNWDLNLGLGKEKIFEVRKNYNDFTALMAFFTPEFCEKHEFFNWKRYPNGDIKLEDRSFKEIKHNLLKKYMNGGLPEITLQDPNHKGKGYMFLEHKFEGRDLHMRYLEPVLQSLCYFWKNDVYLSTKNKFGEEIIYCCYSSEDGMTEVLTREAYEEKMLN